jgi:hypothetical protein
LDSALRSAPYTVNRLKVATFLLYTSVYALQSA